MLRELEQNRELSQLDAVLGIALTFGADYLYENRNGRPAIDKRVLSAFKNLSSSTVVWDRAEFCWRMRSESANELPAEA